MRSPSSSRLSRQRPHLRGQRSALTPPSRDLTPSIARKRSVGNRRSQLLGFCELVDPCSERGADRPPAARLGSISSESHSPEDRSLSEPFSTKDRSTTHGDARPARGSRLRGCLRFAFMARPERPSPAPPCCRGRGDDQLATLKRAQRDVQRPRSELELCRELRGRDGARVAGRDHIEHRPLARGEVVDRIARQTSP